MKTIPTAHQLDLLDKIHKYSPSSLADIVELIGGTRANAKFRLDAVKKHGWVKVDGGGGERPYALTASGYSWLERLS